MSHDNEHSASGLQDLDPEPLARVIKGAEDPGIREQAAAPLLKVVQSLAKRVATKLGLVLLDREQLAEDAASHVFLMLCSCKFDPEKGRFVPWASEVAKNYITDELRRRRREIPRNQLMSTKDASDESFQPWVEFLEALPKIAVPDPSDLISVFSLPFVADDLLAVSQWHPLRDRIIMLVLSGLWCKVPEWLWKEWVEAAELPSPFPPEAMLDLHEKEQRLGPLAEAMGLTRNHLCVIWNRRRKWLVQLRCIRELAEEHGYGNPLDMGRST